MMKDLVKMMVVALFSLLLITACSGGGGGVSQSPNISIAQSTIDFGGVVLNNNADSTIEIKNTGNADLAIGSISGPNAPFTVTNDTCSDKTLGPAQTCSLNVHFAPISQGNFTGSFSIASNDPDLGSASFNLTGEGYGLNTWINNVQTGTCPGPEINMEVNVSDPNDALDLSSLNLANFTLTENGIPINQQNITFTNLLPSTVSVVVTLDWTASVVNVLPYIGTAAKSFVDQLRVTDEAAICKFNNLLYFYPMSSPYFITGEASGKTELKTFIDSSIAIQGGTRLYDAVFQSIDRAAQGSMNKRVVIVLSDGVESSGTNPSIVKTLDQVIANAKQKGIPVFTIYYVDPNYSGGTYGNPQLLQRLAQETGGQYYNSVNADLTAIFQHISRIISGKYTLKYASSSSCTGTLSLGVQVDYNGLYGKDSKSVTFP